MAPRSDAQLLGLPAHILEYLLEFLSPVSLASSSSTCRALYTLATQDRLWAVHLHALDLAATPDLPAPFPSHRALYAAHYPYWHVPAQRLWFTDGGAYGDPAGQLALATYDPATGRIEAHAVVADRAGAPDDFPDGPNLSVARSAAWARGPGVAAAPFYPRVRLFREQPAVRLEPRPLQNSHRPMPARQSSHGGQSKAALPTRMGEVDIVTRGETVHARIFPARALPPRGIARSTAVWPPRAIPARSRVHRDSASKFRDGSHRPSCEAEVSPDIFRVRRWM